MGSALPLFAPLLASGNEALVAVGCGGASSSFVAPMREAPSAVSLTFANIYNVTFGRGAVLSIGRNKLNACVTVIAAECVPAAVRWGVVGDGAVTAVGAVVDARGNTVALVGDTSAPFSPRTVGFFLNASHSAASPYYAYCFPVIASTSLGSADEVVLVTISSGGSPSAAEGAIEGPTTKRQLWAAWRVNASYPPIQGGSPPRSLCSVSDYTFGESLFHFTQSTSLLSAASPTTSETPLRSATPPTQHNTAPVSSSRSESPSLSLVPAAAVTATATATASRTEKPIVTLRPIPADRVSEEAAKMTGTGVGAVAVVAAFTPHPSMGLGVTSAWKRLATCGGGDDADSLPFLVHPLRFRFGAGEDGLYCGAAIGNGLLIPAAVAFVNFVVAPWGYITVRRCQGGGEEMDIAQARRAVGWPAVLVVPFVTLAEGLAAAIVRSLSSGTAHGVAMGCFALVSLLACLWAWAHTLFVLVPRSSCRLRWGTEEEEGEEEENKEVSVRARVLRCVEPRAEWIPAAAEAPTPADSASVPLLHTPSSVAPPPPSDSDPHPYHPFSFSISAPLQEEEASSKISPRRAPPSKALVEACQTLLGDKGFYYADLGGICCSVVVGAMEGLQLSPGVPCGTRAFVAFVATATQCGLGLTTLVRAEFLLQIPNTLLVLALALIATILAFSDDGSDPSPDLMQTMEGLQTGSNLAQLASIVVGILPVVVSLPFFGGGSSEVDTADSAAVQSPPSDGSGGWAISDGLSTDTGALTMPPPPCECEGGGEEMGSLSVAPQLPDDADPCGPERVEEERRPRVSSDPSEKRRRSLSAADGPIPAASESVTAPPRTRQPIRDGAGDVSLEEAERRQAAFEKRLKDGADMDEAMRAYFHGVMWAQNRSTGQQPLDPVQLAPLLAINPENVRPMFALR